MRTPWDIARLAASALSASAGLQDWCSRTFGAPLAVYLGGPGSDFKALPRPFAIVRIAAAEDGAKSSDSVDLSIVVGIDATQDPVTGAEADLTKPATMPDGVRLVGRGGDLVILAGFAADEAADALPDCVVGKRAFAYRTGLAPVESAAAVLTVLPGIGFYDPDAATLTLNHPPTEET